jgi:hypothetical protein
MSQQREFVEDQYVALEAGLAEVLTLEHDRRVALKTEPAPF